MRSKDPAVCSHYFMADPRTCAWCGWDFRNGEPPATPQQVDMVAVLDALHRRLHDGRFYDDHDKASEQLGELRELRAAMSGLIADLRQARASLAQNGTFPADIALARTAIESALVRVQGGAA